MTEETESGLGARLTSLPSVPSLPSVEQVNDALPDAVDLEQVGAVVAATGEHRIVTTGARFGFALDGMLHLLIGWVALKLAWGLRGGTADEAGALGLFAGNTLGIVVLVVAAVGFGLVALWEVIRGLTGKHCPDALTRLAVAGEGIAYAGLAWSAAAFAMGAGRRDTDSYRTLTASILDLPAGRVLVALLGLVVIGVGGFLAWMGVRSHFLDDLERDPGSVATWLGRIGYVAKGLGFVVMGGLFCSAAWYARSAEATGLDGAVRTLREQPYGRYVLTLFALGFMCFGVYLFAQARFQKV